MCGSAKNASLSHSQLFQCCPEPVLANPSFRNKNGSKKGTRSTPASARRTPRRTHPRTARERNFFELLPLGLSRACLGKCSAPSVKRRKEPVFFLFVPAGACPCSEVCAASADGSSRAAPVCVKIKTSQEASYTFELPYVCPKPVLTNARGSNGEKQKESVSHFGRAHIVRCRLLKRRSFRSYPNVCPEPVLVN